jgi:hypothetical protein
MGKLPPPFYIVAVVVLAFGGIPKGKSHLITLRVEFADPLASRL